MQTVIPTDFAFFYSQFTGLGIFVVVCHITLNIKHYNNELNYYFLMYWIVGTRDLIAIDRYIVSTEFFFIKIKLTNYQSLLVESGKKNQTRVLCQILI